MGDVVSKLGYRAGLAAFAAAISYDVVQVLQVVGALRFPLDQTLIYGSSLCIVVPFLLEMLAFHHSTPAQKQFWTHAALLFTTLYAVFVTANYVVQLGTVLPSRVSGNVESIAVLEQTPHSMFWDFDAIGYICMGLAHLIAVPALGRQGVEIWVRRAFVANALVTPLISVVYFYPRYSPSLLFLGFPWAVTAPAAILTLAISLRDKHARSLASA